MQQPRHLTDVEQMLRNEYLKLNRAIEQRAAALEVLEARVKKHKIAAAYPPRWYNVEFDFTPGDLQPQERVFTVESAFRPYALQSSLRVVGQDNVGGAPTAGQIKEVTLAWGPTAVGIQPVRNFYFDYFWQVRDTGTDREWQNLPQPSMFMGANSLTPLRLPRPSELPSGTDVFITIDPFRSQVVAASAGPFYSVSNYKLAISFFGTEKV